MLITKKSFTSFTRPKLSLKIDKHIISETNQTKFLGVIIDNKLSWKQHISHICGKVSKGIGIIIKTCKHLSKEALKSMYYSFIYPYLTYCNHIWGSASISILNRLFILQKKAIRIICGAKRRDPTDPLFLRLKLLPLYDINTFLIGQFMYRVFHKKVPCLFDNYFMLNCVYHSYETRQRYMYHLPTVRTEYAKNSIKYKGASIWNNILKLGIDHFMTLPTFKYHLKKSIMDKKNCKNHWNLVIIA